jgi:hypothetical protein
MKEDAAATRHSAQNIQTELSTLLLRAESAARSANVLLHLILAHKTALVSDATILNETVALLQHSAQNFQLIYVSAIRCPGEQQRHPFNPATGNRA